MLKKVKEEAVLNSARAEFQRRIQEHICLNTDFLTSFLSMLGFNLSGRWLKYFTTPAEVTHRQANLDVWAISWGNTFNPRPLCSPLPLRPQPMVISPGKISFLTSRTHIYKQFNATSLLFWLIQKRTKLFSEEIPECVQLYEIPLTRAQGMFLWQGGHIFLFHTPSFYLYALTTPR